MLTIKNLRVNYHNKNVLNGIDLDVNRGEITAVIGESGAGKTTLGLSIIGLVEGRCRGKILFESRDILAMPEAERRRLRGREMAMLFQNIEDALHPLYTVIDQVVEAITEHNGKDRRAARTKALALLARTGLERRHGDAFPHQLSGGEKQRALLAMALANDPALLVLDEPTAALDAVTRLEISGEIRKAARNKAVLLITHDISTAAGMSDKVTVLYAGKVVEQGPAANLLRSPMHPYTRGLLRSYPNMTTTKDLQGVPGRSAQGVIGCPFHPRCTQRIERCKLEEPALLPAGERMLACHRGGVIPLLEIKGLEKSFGQTAALQGIDLILYEGETVAVVGESGSGKTTLAKTVMGFYPKHGGDVRLETVKLCSRNKDFFKRVQMIFQNPGESFNHRLNVLQAVREPLDVQNMGGEEEKVERVRQALDDVELPADDHFLENYPHHLSGGELQRVAIARALVLEPKLLIADEPTAALDASIQAKIMKLLLNLQEKKGLALLLITHDLALARKVSDRIAVMRDGKVVEQGPAAEITANPVEEYTRRLLRAAPSLETGEMAE